MEKLVKDGSIVKDADTLDLYDYACALVPIDYPETLGELRMRLVKAAPKDLATCQRCLDATLANFDWVHAQQVSPLPTPSLLASIHVGLKGSCADFQLCVDRRSYGSELSE